MRSMTAYAMAEEKRQKSKIKVILRTLNFKYLDICFHNLPQSALILEEKMREAIKKKISRGKVEVYLYQSGENTACFQINQKKFDSYVRQIKKLATDFGLKKEISPFEVLSLPGVVSDSSGAGFSRTQALSALKKALDRLVAFKQEKGEAIKRELIKNLNFLDANIKQIKKAKKLAAAEDESRQDIEEELALISFYSKKLRQKINSKTLLRKGKEIDFLSQEILRELNASSSKIRQKILANLIVEGKNYLGRIREQAQNIE